MNRQVKSLKDWTIVLLTFIVLFCNTILAKYSGGMGEPNAPYQIANVADLLTLANDVNDYNKCFIMTADINLDPNLLDRGVFTSAVIAPDINNSNNYFDGNSFIGIFDGYDHKILNLTIDTNGIGNDYLGLFGDVNIGGVVKNLGLENIDIKSSPVSYSFCLGGLAGSNEGSINNCHSTGNLNGNSSVGGLIGRNDSGNIDNCYSKAGVVSREIVGGLVGYNQYAVIKNSYSAGNVNASPVHTDCYAGGLSGYNYFSSIDNSYATGNVNVYSSLGLHIYAGGLTGRNYGASDSNCYATGDVNIIGPKYIFTGGLVGENLPESNIMNCYATGSVESSYSGSIGGLVGRNWGNINNSYFLDPSDGGGPDNGYGEPLTDEEMKQQSSFVGWDFNDIWSICETTNYPKLLWQILIGDIVCPDGVDIYDLNEMCEQWLLEEIPADLAPPGGDGIVDFADFVIFANQWGITNYIYDLLDFTGQWLKIGLSVCSADISPLPEGDRRVNEEDFAVLANDWLK